MKDLAFVLPAPPLGKSQVQMHGGRKSAFVCEIMKRVHTFPCAIVKLCNFAFVHVGAVKFEVGLVDDDFPSKLSLQGI